MPALTEKWRLLVSTKVSNGSGGFTTSLADGDLVWGEQPAKSDIDATLDDLAAGVIVKRRRALRIRWRANLAAGDFIRELRNDREWQILTLSEVGRRRFVDCLLEAV